MTTNQLTPIQGIRRELQRTVRTYITGQPEPGGGLGVADDSWFGKDSVTWLVHSDWSTTIGGVASLFIQTLHPPTMSGVAQHSNYKDDPFGRLHRTANFIGTTTFGSAEDAQRLIRRIRGIHSKVTGTTPDGAPYEANDPHNLGWVHATEVYGFLAGYRRYGNVAISNAEADTYVAEMARVGEALGVDRAPRSVDELHQTLEAYRPELKFDRQAREAVRWLLLPPNRVAAQAPYLIIASAALNLLPGWARRQLWLPPNIPFVTNRLVEPPAKTLIHALDWIMEPPPEIEALRAERSSL